MKKVLFFVFAVCVLASCQRTQEAKVNTKISSSFSSGCGEGNIPSTFIPIDSANKMISSYLTSINDNQNDSSLRSLIFNADSLRAMLNDTTNGKIAKLKVMFSHTLSYINANGAGRPCGYTSGKLTFILAGYNCEGNYVLHPAGVVIDNGMPCPTNCPPSGTAAANLISN